MEFGQPVIVLDLLQKILFKILETSFYNHINNVQTILSNSTFIDVDKNLAIYFNQNINYKSIHYQNDAVEKMVGSISP